MKNILIIHGAGGHPKENWFPWLKEKLEKEGFTVTVPQFPNRPEAQTVENWMKVLEDYNIDWRTIAIGHSLGCPFLLSVLEKAHLASAYFVAGFTGLLNNEFDSQIRDISNRDFDWPSIRSNCSNFQIFYSNNDPYVKPEKAYELGKNLNTETILIEEAGHFNSSSGYNQFELLLEMIKKEL